MGRKDNNPVPLFDYHEIETNIYAFIDCSIDSIIQSSNKGWQDVAIAGVYALVLIAAALFLIAKKIGERNE